MKKIKGLLYCCKAKPYLVDERKMRYHNFVLGDSSVLKSNEKDLVLNGKIVAECDFEVEKLKRYHANTNNYLYETNTLDNYDVAYKTKLAQWQIEEYLKEKNGYALHIKNLHIFDEPKELDDFTTRTPVYYDSIICDSCTDFGFDCKKCRYSCDYQQVIKAPKNMMKVCEWDIEDKVLISIKPEELCRILNGEKDIVVRKKVLKEMLENEK